MRYLKATLLIGLVTTLICAALHETGVLARMDVLLWEFLGELSSAPMPRPIVQYSVIAVLGFGIAWTTIDINKATLKTIVAAGALFNLVSATWVLNFYYQFFSPFAGILAVTLSFGMGFCYSRSQGGRRKKTLRLMFGDRLSRKSFYALLNSNQQLNFEGDECEASVLVCEIFNHDELMSSLTVADYVAMTNLFLRTASDFLVEKGAYLDECDGESLRVIFGAPLGDPQHAATASEAALELLRRLDNLNRECEVRWNKILEQRIGINSGEIVTAAYGSERLATYSVAGEPVEFARRLCAANTIYGSRILIGSRTYNLAANNIEVRPMEIVRGRDNRLCEEIYELLELKSSLSREEIERRDRFWKGIIYFRENRWDEALGEFEAVIDSDPDDLPAQFYVRRIEHMRSGATPALQWSGDRF